MPTNDGVHWYYPSGIIPCGAHDGRIDDLVKMTDVVTHFRDDVTCPACKVRLEADKTVCARCRTGNLDLVHTCDPGGRK